MLDEWIDLLAASWSQLQSLSLQHCNCSMEDKLERLFRSEKQLVTLNIDGELGIVHFNQFVYTGICHRNTAYLHILDVFIF